MQTNQTNILNSFKEKIKASIQDAEKFSITKQQLLKLQKELDQTLNKDLKQKLKSISSLLFDGKMWQAIELIDQFLNNENNDLLPSHNNFPSQQINLINNDSLEMQTNQPKELLKSFKQKIQASLQDDDKFIMTKQQLQQKINNKTLNQDLKQKLDSISQLLLRGQKQQAIELIIDKFLNIENNDLSPSHNNSPSQLINLIINDTDKLQNDDGEVPESIEEKFQKLVQLLDDLKALDDSKQCSRILCMYSSKQQSLQLQKKKIIENLKQLRESLNQKQFAIQPKDIIVEDTSCQNSNHNNEKYNRDGRYENSQDKEREEDEDEEEVPQTFQDDQYEDAQKDYIYSINIPDCAYKFLVELNFRIQQVKHEKGVFDDPYKENLFKNLKERIQLEISQHIDYNQKIDEIYNNMKIENSKQASRIISELIRKIRKLNMFHLKRLIDEGQISINLVQQKDIVLFLGNTGSGKSTTIHYLAGSKFREIQVKGLQHLAPIKLKENFEYLKHVKTGNRVGQSITRSIFPVKIQTENIRAGIHMCDAPGFEDFGNSYGNLELAISNGVNIFQAIQKCNSVRFVLVINYEISNNRYEGLQHLATTLLEMINFRVKDFSFDNFLKSIFYVFTKYSETNKRQLPQALQALIVSETHDEFYQKFLKDILIKLQKNTKAIFINPLNTDNREQVLNQLISMNKIEYPQEQFKFSVAPNQIQIIQGQLSNLVILIISALKRNEFQLVQYHMDDIQILENLLQENEISNEIVDTMREYFTNKFNQGWEQLNKSLSPKNELNRNEIEEFLKIVNLFQRADKLINNQSLQVPGRSNLLHKINQYLTEASKGIVLDLDKIIPEEAEQVYFQVKMIVHQFQTLINFQKEFILIVEAFNNYKSGVIEKFNISLMEQQFSDCSDQILLLQNMYERFNQEDNFSFFDIDILKRNMFNNIKNIVEVCILYFNREILEQQQVNQIVKSNQLINEALISPSYDHSHQENFSELQGVLLNKMIEQFQQIQENINKYINEIQNNGNSEQLEQLKNNLNMMKLMKHIRIQSQPNNMEEIYSSTLEEKYSQTLEEIYSSTLSNICQKLQDIGLEIEREITNLSQQQFFPSSSQNYRNRESNSESLGSIKKNLEFLQNMDWINSFHQESYDDIMRRILDKIDKHVQDLINVIQFNEFSLDDFKKLGDTNYYINESMQFLVFDEIKKNYQKDIEKLKVDFEDRISYILNQIKKDWIKNPGEQIQENRVEEWIDYRNLNQTLIFLTYCMDNGIKYKQSDQIQRNLCSEIRQWGNQIEKLIDAEFEKMKSQVSYNESQESNNENDFFSGNGFFVLQELFCKITEVSSKYPMIGEKFNEKNQIIQKQQKYIDDYFEQLTSHMNKNYREWHIGNNLQDLNLYISITYKFSRIDQFLNPTNTRFRDLYSEFEKQIYQDTQQIYSDILPNIDKCDFQSVRDQFNNLEGVSKIISIKFTNAKRYLNNSIKFQISSLQTNIARKQHLEKKEDVDGLVDNLQTLKDAEKYIKDFLEQEISLTDQIQKINEIIIKQLSDLIQKTRNLYQSFDFVLGNILIENIKSVCLQYHEQPDLKDTYAATDEAIQFRDSQVQQLIQKFDQCKNLQDLINESSQELFEKLNIENNKNELQLIKKKILDIVSEELLQLQEKESIFQITKFQLNHLSSKTPWELELNETITPQLLLIEEGYQRQNLELNSIIEIGDLKQLGKYLEDYKNDKDIVQRIKSQIIEQFRQQKQKFLSNRVPGQENFQLILNTIDQIFEFQEINPNIFSQQLIQLSRAFSADIQNALENSKQIFTNYLNTLYKQDEQDKKIYKFRIENPESCQNYFQYYEYYELNIQKLKQLNLHTQFLQSLKSISTLIVQITISIQQSFQDRLQAHEIKQLLPMIKKINKFDQEYRDFITKVNQFLSDMRQDSLINWDKQNFIKLFKDQIGDLDFSKNFTPILIPGCPQQEYFEKYNTISQTINLLNEASILREGQIESWLNDSIIQIQNRCETKLRQTMTNLYNAALDFLKDLSNDLNCINIELIYSNISAATLNIQSLSNFEINLEDLQQRLELEVDKLGKLQEYTIQNTIQRVLILHTIGDNISIIKDVAQNNLEKILEQFQNQNQVDFDDFMQKLGQETIGKVIITEYKILKGQKIRIWNERAGVKDYHKIIEELIIINELKKINEFKIINEINIKSQQQLINRYQKFNKTYRELISQDKLEKYYRKEPEYLELLATKVKRDSRLVSKTEQLISYIFAYWTFQDIKYFYDAQKSRNLRHDRVNYQEKYKLTPTPGQIIAILRILCTDQGQDMKTALKNNLAEIKTGEGQSIVLAVIAIVLALNGFEIFSVCYSQYLSQRDRLQFAPMFKAFNVEKFIIYGTFRSVYEKMINANQNIRDTISNLIKKDEQILKQQKENPQMREYRQAILLIDEVDVFFDQSLLSSMYQPTCKIFDSKITDFVKYIWENRNKIQDISQLKITQEYTNLVEKFSKWKAIIDESIKDMLFSLDTFENIEYKVDEDKIWHQDQDIYTSKLAWGYNTMFLYFKEFEANNITGNSLNQNVYILINCGQFSYAQITDDFLYVFGVSGTLSSLKTEQLNIIQDDYKIRRFTIIPSIYEQSKLKFDDDLNVKLVNGKIAHRTAIQQEINDKIKEYKRSILIFFEDEKSLYEFYNSNEFDDLKKFSSVLTEQLKTKEIQEQIKQATYPGKITFCTQYFGRGSDFIILHKSVIDNGGVHVIQTFLSEELSEEIQIKGRAARQGQDGSYSMVLQQENLHQFQIDSNIRENKLYQELDKYRNQYFSDMHISNKSFMESNYQLHSISRHLLVALQNSDQQEQIQEFLLKLNNGRQVVSKNMVSKIIIALDGTASMNTLITKAQNSIGQMFQRAKKMLQDHKADLKQVSFKLQLIVFRDYDCLDKILQVSPWQTRTEELYQFMEQINSYGGEDIPEAIEIAFWHAVQQSKKEGGVDHVILIGDAPPKRIEEIKDYRQQYRNDDFWKTRYGQANDYEFYLNELVRRKIQVSPCYLSDTAKTDFQKIAQLSDTEPQQLEINQPAGAEQLQNIVIERILKEIGDQQARTGKIGDRLIEDYRKQLKSNPHYFEE